MAFLSNVTDKHSSNKIYKFPPIQLSMTQPKESNDDPEPLNMEALSKYAGQWIGIVKGRIIAHDESMIEVHEELKKEFPNEAGFLGRISGNKLSFLIQI